jgi:dolichyl-phosphate-mannose-protein mannosyltransferase
MSMMSINNFKVTRLLPAIGVSLLLLVFCLISSTAALQKSPTYDEPVHLFAGYSYLNWGDYRINPEHPPLAKILAALPLLIMNIDTAGITRAQLDFVQHNKVYGWVLADHFFLSNSNAESLFFRAKLVMVGLAAMLGIFIFLWGRELFGLRAGIAALGLYCFDPNILAHSSIVHTDIPFALCFFAGTYFFWRTSNRVTWIDLFCTSLFFAFAAITKFSFLLILPIWAVLGIIRAFSAEPQQSQVTSPEVVDTRLSKLMLVSIVITTAAIFAYVVLWTAYGFRFDAVGQQKGELQIGALLSNEDWLSPLVLFNSKYFAFPEAWVYGLVDALKNLNRSSYLLGETSNNGFWLYFPVAFALKTPLPTLLLFVLAVVLILLRPQLAQGHLFLLIPAFVFFSLAVWSRFNIGMRHILPVYPFLFVWLGGFVATICLSRKWWARWGTVALGIWLISSVVRVYPDYLAYFNEVAGGPENGHKFLVDSNLDWGQDLKGLKRWMDDYGVQKIEFAYFGTMDPSSYGINAIPALGSNRLFWRGGKDHSPTSPYVAISATYLAGLYLADRDTYALFRSENPIASIGHSILVYRRHQ